MTPSEVDVAKANIEAAGGAPIVSVCSDCDIRYDVRPGGEPYPPDKRISHGYCPPCAKRFRERFEQCKDTHETGEEK